MSAEIHECPVCEGPRRFVRRIEGNLRTLEQWEVIYCVECRWERERKLIHAKVIHVSAE